MSEYRRLISYLYAYDAGVKTINVGFAKAELRNGKLKLFVGVKNVMLQSEQATVHFFYKKRKESSEETYEKIYAGIINLNKGQGEMQARISENELISRNITFENIAGILISENDNVDYVIISSWGEENINPYELMRKQKIYKESNKTENIEADVDISKDSNNQIEYEKPLSDSENQRKEEVSIDSKVQKNNKLLSDSEKQKIEKVSEDNEASVYEAAVIKEDNIFADNSVYELKKINPDELMETVLGEISAMETENAGNSIKTGDINIVNKINNMSNNSFLRHGYYNYDHIIVGKCYDNDTDKELVLIGVPGIFHEKEKFMASMFGFPEFKDVDKSDADKEYNGYWYTYLAI